MKRLPRRICLLGGLLRTLYYRRVDILGTPCRDRPTLYLLSHRNGAIDGIVYQKALGDTPSLISVQLLRGPLHLLFDGIPVVRGKDRARYGIPADAVAAPVAAAIAQLRAGGSLALYPEGTSAWEPRPLPYHSGMAVIAAKLLAAGVDFVVQPAAAYYSKPDGFRSRVSLIFGAPFVPQGESVAALQKELAAALDAVSVNCADAAHFNQVQHAAWQAAQQGEDYGVAFLRAQRANHPANIGCASAHRPLTTELPPHAPPITAASATDTPPDWAEGGGCKAAVTKTNPTLEALTTHCEPRRYAIFHTPSPTLPRFAGEGDSKCKQPPEWGDNSMRKPLSLWERGWGEGGDRKAVVAKTNATLANRAADELTTTAASATDMPPPPQGEGRGEGGGCEAVVAKTSATLANRSADELTTTAASATDMPPPPQGEDRGEGGDRKAVVAKTTPALGHVCNLNFPPLRSGGGAGRGCENRVATAFKTKYKQTLAPLALCLTCPLIVAGACLAARAADGRNNTSFFRILGGMAGALLQIPLWLAALYLAPLAGGLWLAAAALTWRSYPEPAPLPLPETP